VTDRLGGKALKDAVPTPSATQAHTETSLQREPCAAPPTNLEDALDLRRSAHLTR
jgi:hypothetical protein